MSAHKFQMTFANGLTCTVIFDPAIHYDKATNCICPKKHLHPEPQYKDPDSIFPQYVQWMHTVNLELAKIVKAKHKYVVQDRYAKHPFWEMWVYSPNGKKKCVAKGNGIFNPNA